MSRQRTRPLPAKHDDDCLTELRWIYDRRRVSEARSDLAAWPNRPQPPSRTTGSEEHREGPRSCTDFASVITSYTLDHLRERFNDEINGGPTSCLVPKHGSMAAGRPCPRAEHLGAWQEGGRYGSMTLLVEERKEQLRKTG